MLRPKPLIVVSEPDIQAALLHMRGMPHRESLPLSWDRQFVIDLIREAIPATAKVDDWFEFGSGLFGVIKPFGVDLTYSSLDHTAEKRLQIWVAIRAVGTDPTKVTAL